MTITQISVHDTRLPGSIYPRSHVRLLQTDGGESLGDLGRRILTAARSGTVRQLCIFAHGARPAGSSGDGDGRLVMMSSDNLTRGNAYDFGRALAGSIGDRILLYVCCAAARPDGEALCQELARGAGVPVVASRSVQDYRTATWTPTFDGYEIPGVAGPSWINFDQWEGEVVIVNPDGAVNPWFTGPAPTSGTDVTL
jgi:hypothetical protein